MDIYSLLPLLKGWKWEPRDVSFLGAPQPILPGKTFEIAAPVHRRGWISGIGIQLSSPHLFLVVECDAWIIDGSPNGCNFAGLTQPQNTGLWVSRFDTTVIPNMFSMALTPSSPIPFSKYFHAYLKNPAENITAFLYGFLVVTIEIDDEEQFRASLRKILGE